MCLTTEAPGHDAQPNNIVALPTVSVEFESVLGFILGKMKASTWCKFGATILGV